MRINKKRKNSVARASVVSSSAIKKGLCILSFVSSLRSAPKTLFWVLFDSALAPTARLASSFFGVELDKTCSSRHIKAGTFERLPWGQALPPSLQTAAFSSHSHLCGWSPTNTFSALETLERGLYSARTLSGSPFPWRLSTSWIYDVCMWEARKTLSAGSNFEMIQAPWCKGSGSHVFKTFPISFYQSTSWPKIWA